MASKTYTSAYSALRATMEVCSEMVAAAYAKPFADLEVYTGELPPGHRSSDRRQRYTVTEREGDMIVALPGTTHPLDWSSNLRVNYTPVDGTTVSDPLTDLEELPCAHAGFFYRSETVPSLQLLQQAAEKGCRLVFTGHSLGGAVANLCALAALNAQKRTLAAAGDHAEAAAEAQHSSSDAISCEMHIPPPSGSQAGASTAAGTPYKNNSCCSCNSNFVLAPQAALVEVLSISFASPVFANAALAQMIESNGWEECFVNLVVPEDYCLNLFNNVLTSAPQINSKSPSRAPSTSRLFRATRMQTEYSEPQEPSEEPIPEAPLDPTGLPVPLVTPACRPRASTSGASDLSSCTPTSSSGASYSYTTPQQPLVSAMAGRSPGKLRSKRQLCFAEPLQQSGEDGIASSLGSTGDSDFSAARPAVGKADSAAAPVPTGRSPDGSQSPSGASLRSQGSSSSTRSWTLFAYLPASLTRTLDSWSSSNSMSSRGGSSSGGSCSGSTDSDTDLYEPFSGWGMRHSRSTMDVSCGLSLSSGGSDSGDSMLTDDLDDLAAPFVSYNSSPCLNSKQLCSNPLCQAVSHSESACASSEGDDAQPQDKHQLQALQEDRKAALRRSFSSASLTILSQGHRKLLQPLSSAFRSTDSVSVVSSLLPSMRAALGASRVVANVAYKVGEKAFNVPLGALEAGLIRALQPPMYEPVGQQWILSATGLVPQHQPIHQYPKHVSDVYWHKELTLVAFKEHSIVFYKRRLLQQASRR